MKHRALDPAKARAYAAKAEEFAAGARDDLAAERWNRAVSSAAHAVISAVDAVCIRRMGLRSASPDHAEAAALLGEVPGLPAEERATVQKHIRTILSLKHAAEYEERLLEADEARRVVQAMDRALPKLLRWASDA